MQINKVEKELIDEKYYPNVQCYQVFCKMTHEFMYEYLNNKNILMKRLLAGLNPNKIMTLHRLIRMHEDKGDKIIVYGDILFILKEYGFDDIKGELNIPSKRYKEEVILEEGDDKNILERLELINQIIKRNDIPEAINISACKKCAYYEFCYI